MADFVRRLVSGDKTRFRDDELGLDLDLAYITDQVIVMGYPSKGVEGLYRNRREDAKKFLEHRHGKNFWVFNFCPVKENSYSATFFGGRVSRYPFPDHHAPPMAILPLVAREMRVWLDGSPERVAVLHCKAGKGRSGTIACAYLLTLSGVPQPSTVGRSRTTREIAKQRAEEIMNVMPTDDDATSNAEEQMDASQASEDPIKHEISDPESDGATPPRQTKTDMLQHVLDLHTAGRMKRPSTPSEKKVKPGVSIPSQRRWLYYWSLLIARQAPPGLWSLNPIERNPTPKVRLTHIKLQMKELSGLKVNLLRAANTLFDKTGKGKARDITKGNSHVWASLARYDDELVDALERWERVTRPENGDMGRRKCGSEHEDEGDPSQIFVDAKWDTAKMVRPFARLGSAGNDTVCRAESNQEDRTVTYTLRPLAGGNSDALKADLEGDFDAQEAKNTTGKATKVPVGHVANELDSTGDAILDADREVRVKLYMGQVFMCWFWFIPTFHMKHPRTSATGNTTLRLTRKELDFPLGIGSHIVDIEVSMEWCSEHADVVRLTDREGNIESQQGKDDPSGVAAAIQATVSGHVSEAVEALQAGED